MESKRKSKVCPIHITSFNNILLIKLIVQTCCLIRDGSDDMQDGESKV